ncbi:MAG TPA: protein phosphatase 2C domain-containing protein [Pseudonocardiaceae bacterium]|nr:protein phosphatase 2C domain-containing protein [Pseudonocardiaceae bacterium]
MTSVRTPCPACHAGTLPDARFCDHCGHRLDRRSPPVLCAAPLARSAEFDLDLVAGGTDVGRCRARNEDAMAIGRVDTATATVAAVCDGVASSPRSEMAAVAAARAGVTNLVRALGDAGSVSADVAVSATGHAAIAAADAAADTGRGRPTDPPCCTYLSALLTSDAVTLGWLGDSPAFWVSGDEVRRLTVDDSLAGRLAADGVPPDDPRYAQDGAQALDRWLGADARRAAPHVVTFVPPGPGMVLACTDGLSRYLDGGHIDPTDLSGSPVEWARALIGRALDAGGHDNITVAVLAFPPRPEGAR